MSDLLNELAGMSAELGSARQRPGDPGRGEHVRAGGCGDVLGQGVGHPAWTGRPRRICPRTVRARFSTRWTARRWTTRRYATCSKRPRSRASGPRRSRHSSMPCASGRRASGLSGTPIHRLPWGCSAACAARELFAGCLFPDQIAVLGPALAYVPYADPGLPLALTVRQALAAFVERYQRGPENSADGEPRHHRAGQHRAGGVEPHADAGKNLPDPGPEHRGRRAALSFPGPGRAHRHAARRVASA